MIAALGDFKIGKMTWRQPEPRRGVIGNVLWPAMNVHNRNRVGFCIPSQRFHFGFPQAFLSVLESLTDNLWDTRDLVDADERIDFWQKFWQVLLEPLRQTARDNDALMRILPV